MTYTTALATPDPLIYHTGPGIELLPQQQPELLQSDFFFSPGVGGGGRAAPVAYASAKPRGQIIAAAASLCHRAPFRSHVCNLHHSSQQGGIFNPRDEARDLLNYQTPKNKKQKPQNQTKPRPQQLRTYQHQILRETVRDREERRDRE